MAETNIIKNAWDLYWYVPKRVFGVLGVARVIQGVTQTAREMIDPEQLKARHAEEERAKEVEEKEVILKGLGLMVVKLERDTTAGPLAYLDGAWAAWNAIKGDTKVDFTNVLDPRQAQTLANLTGHKPAPLRSPESDSNIMTELDYMADLALHDVAVDGVYTTPTKRIFSDEYELARA